MKTENSLSYENINTKPKTHFIKEATAIDPCIKEFVTKPHGRSGRPPLIDLAAKADRLQRVRNVWRGHLQLSDLKKNSSSRRKNNNAFLDSLERSKGLTVFWHARARTHARTHTHTHTHPHTELLLLYLCYVFRALRAPLCVDSVIRILGVRG